MDTLYANPITGDLCLDINGDIALASSPYAIAQDAASNILTFKGEVYYDTTLGIPYWEEILGQYPDIEYMRSQFVTAALEVPEASSASVFFTSVLNRKIAGQVQITDTGGNITAVGF